MLTIIISRHGDEESAICTCGQWKVEGRNSLETLIKSINHIQQYHEEGLIRVTYLVDTSDLLLISHTSGIHLIDRR